MSLDDLKVLEQTGIPQTPEGMFYTKSDEKFVVRELLEQIFADRKFEKTLDVGPGAGHISEPLARRSQSITMVEKSPQFEPLLKKRFPQARLEIAGIDELELDEQYDIIMLAHVLYYHRRSEWISLVRRMMKHLNPGGEIIIMLNADSGDWWRILSAFWTDLQAHISFDYVPLTVFRKQLSELATMKTHPYRCQMWIDANIQWSDFVAHQILELRDADVISANRARFDDLSRQFKQVDEAYVLDMRAEILRLSPKPQP